MLYKESKEYLLDKLKAAGLKSKPYTTQKALEKSQESHIGAVLFESETLLRNGSKTRYRDQEGAQKKRRKVFDRALAFTVIIGDYTDEAVESMFGAFLSSLDPGHLRQWGLCPDRGRGGGLGRQRRLYSKGTGRRTNQDKV